MGQSAGHSDRLAGALYLFVLRIGLCESRFALFGPMLQVPKRIILFGRLESVVNLTTLALSLASGKSAAAGAVRQPARLYWIIP